MISSLFISAMNFYCTMARLTMKEEKEKEFMVTGGGCEPNKRVENE